MEEQEQHDYKHPIKCTACGLHYLVFSVDPDWPVERKGGYCPECGSWNGDKLVWGAVELTDPAPFIFQHVPGDAPQRELYPAPTPAFGAGGRQAELN